MSPLLSVIWAAVAKLFQLHRLETTGISDFLLHLAVVSYSQGGPELLNGQ